MPDPGFTQPDLCSTCAVVLAPVARDVARAFGTGAGGSSPAAAAGGRGRAMTVSAAASDRHCATATSGIDRAIRLSTAAAVLAVAGIAAYVSYWHAYAVVRAHGESGITARLEPATIDGLVYASSMVVLYAARHRVPVPSLARWLLGLGIAATLTANMAQGWSHGLVGAVVAAWPAVSLVGSYELLVWLIRISGTAERRAVGRAPVRTVRPAVPWRVLPRPRPLAASSPAGASAHVPGQARQPADQVAGQPAIPAGGQRDDAVPEASAVNDAAVAAYRLSVQAGNPLSERQLAQMFGRTSRRWARARITDARQASPLPDSPGTPVTA